MFVKGRWEPLWLKCLFGLQVSFHSLFFYCPLIFSVKPLSLYIEAISFSSSVDLLQRWNCLQLDSQLKTMATNTPHVRAPRLDLQNILEPPDSQYTSFLLPISLRLHGVKLSESLLYMFEHLL